MPRDGGGTYSLPAGYLATTGQVILASTHNVGLEDLAAAMTASLPRNGAAAMTDALNMGGFAITNAAAITGTVITGTALKFAQAADIASAATTDIGAALGNYVKVTGTTTI